MNNNYFELYGAPTPSDLHFMESATSSFPSASSTSTLSSTSSDAQSAPPELEQVFDGICQKSAELLRVRGREFPPEWNIGDLVQAIMGDDAFRIPGHLQDTYYDVLLRGDSSWLLEDLCNLLDWIHYVF